MVDDAAQPPPPEAQSQEQSQQQSRGERPYAPPEWARGGRNVFGITLEVIKGGVVVETVALPPAAPAPNAADLSFALVGRMAPVCDLVAPHPSISRVHAVLQFDAHGALFLRDLGSTHGTFVNKQRLGQGNSGDDGTGGYRRLHIGDVVAFGESTRLYAVCGPPELLPEEYESANLQALRQRLERRRARAADVTNAKPSGPQDGGDDDGGVSWGFREDAQEEDDEEDEDDDEHSDNDDGPTRGRSSAKAALPDYLVGIKERDRGYESSITAADVSDKDQKLFQQLQARIRKMENLETEKARILAKQNDLQGLSEGQERQLERNNGRIETLMKEIEELEGRIRSRNSQREQSRSAAAAAAAKKSRSGAKKTTSSAAYAYDSDEDEFYDRTRANQQKHAQQRAQSSTTAASKASTSSTVLTAESIQQKIAELQDEMKRVAAEAEDCARRAEAPPAPATSETLDSLDAFMQSTTQEMHSKEAAKLGVRRRELQGELAKQEQLLRIAMPALATKPFVPTKEEEAPPKTVPTATPTTKQVTPAITSNQSPSAPVVGTHQAKEQETPAPPNDANVPIVSPMSADAPSLPPSHSNEPTEPSPPGSIERLESPQLKKKRRIMGPTLPPPSLAPVTDSSMLEGGERAWVPPANQTGDGRTKLNEKYGY